MNRNKQTIVNSLVPQPNGTIGQDNSPKTNWGFQVRRAKVKFQGNVIDPTWQYQINGAFDGSQDNIGSTGDFRFQEVMITKDMENGFSLTFGQFKAPFTREELVSSSQQLAVERSLVNEFFNADRMLGIDALYKQDNWSAEVAYGNGMQTGVYGAQRNTNAFTSPTRWSFAGRFQYKISGDWSDFDSFTSAPGDEQAIMLGVAAMGQQYNSNANLQNALFNNPFLGQLPVGTNLDGSTVYGITFDGSAKFGGLSLFASFTWQHYKTQGRVAGQSFTASSVNPWGLVVQAGYSFTDQWEVFGRFSYANADTGDVRVNGQAVPPLPAAIGTSNARISLLTIGVNYFINSNVKFTADWGINFNSRLASFDSEAAAGWEDSNSADQWVLRAQLQLLF
jgi:hypothetical protein